MNAVEVAIVGAGPYGLSVAAHLRSRGIPFRIFGEPMKTWRVMPRSLSLKSLGFATSIDVPEKGNNFPDWLEKRGLETFEPIPYTDFAEYGLSVQRQHVPEVEPVDVESVQLSAEGGYQLTLVSGERLTARKVVVAVGLGHLQKLPEELSRLPESLVTHSFGHYDFAAFTGKDVAVIGAGQSALEAAVVLHEVGARPLLISRRPPFFYGRTPRERPLLDRILNPITVFGAGRLHWVLEHFPWLVYYLPDARRVRFARRYLGPAGAWWLKERFVGKVPVLAPARLISAREDSGEVVLRLDQDGQAPREVRFAHVVCGSGFEHDLRRFRFLDAALLERIELIQDRAPRLSRTFESSVPGLYFIGPIAAYAFGPMFRFVCGTQFAAPTVAGHLARHRSPHAARSGSIPAPVSAEPSSRARSA